MSLLRILREEVHFSNDPQASWRSRPCDGCAGFCMIDGGNAEARGAADLHEAYGDYECQGVSWIRQETVWHVLGELSVLGVAVGLSGIGRAVEQAYADLEQRCLSYQAEAAANAIKTHGWDG